MDINQENYAQQNIKDSKLPSNSSEIDSSSLHQQDHSSTVIIESASHNHEQEEPTNDVEKTITKLFRSNDQPESLKIADKLIELYEKRGKFIPEIENDEREHFQVASSISMAKKEESDQIETCVYVFSFSLKLRLLITNIFEIYKHPILHSYFQIFLHQ